MVIHKRVGIIGGGQLAWMMAAGAAKLGIELAVQTPSPGDPAVAIAKHTVLAQIDDAAATAQLATCSDVISFENEFVDLAALQQLEQQGVVFYPQLRSLQPLLDKYDQRSYLHQLGLPTPHFEALTPDSSPPTQFPVVLKARRHGYDGQGTHVLRDRADLDTVLATGGNRPGSGKAEPLWLLEEFVPFERELAVMAARSITGELVIYPVVETQQVNQVCQRVYVTHQFDGAVTEQVEAIARTLLENLNYVGVMGIELFLTAEGTVLVNETAPRTHNSGHYSLDACVTSQFEQQLRAVCGLPLGDVSLTCAGAVMVNLLGYESSESDYAEKRQQIAAIPNAHLYWYSKKQSRPGRKLGHVTVLLDDPTAAEAIAHSVEAIWYP